MSKKEREPGYNNKMKIECGEELKRILLEQGIKEVIDQGFEVTKKDGSFIRTEGTKYRVYIEGHSTFGSHYLIFEEAIKEFLKPLE
jgi:hypothetical protein